jgi:hypothetical protein
MRVPRALFLLVLSCLLSIPGRMTAQSGGTIDWDYEIDLLGRELAEKHPDLFFKKDSSSFFSKMRKVAAGAPGKPLFDVAVELQQILARMGDEHTLVNYHFLVDKSLILPVECYWFEDGIYVTQTDRAYETLLGKKITGINGTPLQTIIDSLSTLLVNDNPSRLKYQIPRMLTWTQLLTHFGFSTTEKVSLQVSGDSGNGENVVISLPVSLGEIVRLGNREVPLGWQDQTAYFRQQYLDGEKIFYIQYNRGWSREVEEEFGSGASALFMPSFKEFDKELFQVLRKKEVDKLVFDLRFNSGGQPGQGNQLIRDLHRARIRGKGRFFLLVGRKTSAEGLINALEYMKYPDVTVVGEETGGRPNHFGEVRRFVLPESGLIVSHSTRYFELLPEDLPSISPEVETPMSFRQFLEGIDPAIEAVRNYPLP